MAATAALALLAPSGGAMAESASALAEAAILARLKGESPATAIPALPVFARLPAPRPLSAEARRALVPLAEAAAARHGVDGEFFKRLIRQESGFNTGAVSSAGAQGIAQFMPGTAAALGLDDPFDPHKALPKSAEHLADLSRRLGNAGLAAAAYNAGEGRVRAWLAGRSGLPAETAHYVLAITGRQAHEWAPAGATPGPLGTAVPGGARLPVFARAGSAEWQLGATLLGSGQARLAALLGETPARRPARSVASRPAAGGERALCAQLGCTVATVY